MVLRARHLRTIGAAAAIALISQIGLSGWSPVHAAGPGDPATSTWVTSDTWDVALGDTVTLEAGTSSYDGPVPDGRIAFIANTDADSVLSNANGLSTYLTAQAGAPVADAGMVEFEFTFTDAWFAANASGPIRPSEVQSLEIVASYLPAPGSELLASASEPITVSVPGDGGPGDGGPGGPADPGGSTGPATTLTASATTVEPGGSVTFTASVADGGSPLTSGTFALLANADAASVFNCATVCSTMMASATPDGAGQARFTVTMDDATFIAKSSAIRPSSEAPVHFGVMYSPPVGSELEPGRSATAAVTAREVPPVVEPVPTTTTLSTLGVTEVSIGTYVTLSARVTAVPTGQPAGVVHFYAASTDDREADRTRLSPAEGVKVTLAGSANYTAKMDTDWFKSKASGPARPIPGSSLRLFAEFTPSNPAEQAASSSSLRSMAFKKIATPITVVRTDGSGTMTDGATAVFWIGLPTDAVGTLSIACPGSSCTTSAATVIGALKRQVTVSNTGNAPVERTITATFRSTSAKYADATASTTLTVDPAARASQSIPDIDTVSSTFDLTLPSGSGSHGGSTEISATLAYGLTNGGTVSVASWDGSAGRTGTGAHRKAATKVVQCAAVKPGSLLCLLGSYKPGTRLRITAVVDVPAAMAGKTATLTSSVTALDPVTGVTTTLLTKTTRHTIAKRTALAGALMPGAKSVRRGKKATYTATLTNGGVFAAKGVKTCLQTAKGVKIAKAKQAKLNKAKTKACWTVSLKPKKSASSKITFTAPKKKGKTAITWTVRPRKSQADGFTLKAQLPVK